MRANDQDVTGCVRTTDPASVGAEVARLYRGLFPGDTTAGLQRAFRDAAALYRGEHPDYCPCDTEYHDIQHVLDVTLAMSRLMDGYQRGRGNGEEPLTPELFTVSVAAALFHDFGYLRRRRDRRHRYGAEYTLNHVSRGAAFLRRYVRGLGLAEELSRFAGALLLLGAGSGALAQSPAPTTTTTTTSTTPPTSTTPSPYESLSPGNQKIASALFEAQQTTTPSGGTTLYVIGALTPYFWITSRSPSVVPGRGAFGSRVATGVG